MTSITATSYAAYYTASTAGSATAKTASSTTATTSSGTGSSAATTITLSDAAKAALAGKDFTTVVAETRAALDKLLKADGATAATIDLAGLDRRALFAIASNAEGKFTDAEQSAAKTEAAKRRDDALAGPYAVARVTDHVEGLYTAALAFLDAASAEEKATPAWAAQKAATLEAQKQLAADPSKIPTVDGDIVADYISRAATGDTAKPSDFADVATDARTALDKQYADAKAAGLELVFQKSRKTGQQADLSRFDSRALSAIALNQGDQFTGEEVLAAKAEMRARSGAAVLAGFKAAASGSDPTAFAQNIISAYGSMSAEERQAAGWSESFYAAAVANYKSASSLADMFASAGGSVSGSGMSLLDYL